MVVIRDALLSQLQKDRLRQEIIVAELAKIERAMALRSASYHGVASADAGRATSAPLASDEQLKPHRHSLGTADPQHYVGVDKVRDVKKEVVELKSEKPDMENPVGECLKTCCGTATMARQENAALDECKQEYNGTILPQKTPSAKWKCAVCQVEATSEGNLLQHLAGQKHRANAIALKAKAKADKLTKARHYADRPHPTWVCRFCQANCTGKSVLENHLKGKRNQAKIQALLEECKSMAKDSVSQEVDSHQSIVPHDEAKPASVSICCICQVKCACQSVMGSHLRGKKHQMNVQALHLEAKRLGIIPPKIAKKQHAAPDWHCSICQAKCNSESQFQDHCRSMGHQQKIEALHREGSNAKSSGLWTDKKPPTAGSDSKGAGSEELEIQRALYFCRLCNLQCNSKTMLAEHRRRKKHLKVEKRCH